MATHEPSLLAVLAAVIESAHLLLLLPAPPAPAPPPSACELVDPGPPRMLCSHMNSSKNSPSSDDHSLSSSSLSCEFVDSELPLELNSPSPELLLIFTLSHPPSSSSSHSPPPLRTPPSSSPCPLLKRVEQDVGAVVLLSTVVLCSERKASMSARSEWRGVTWSIVKGCRHQCVESQNLHKN